MSLPALPQLHFEDQRLQNLFLIISTLFKIAGDCVLLEGVHLTSIDLSTSQVSIAHGLGRDVKGYVITSKSANVNIFDDLATAANKDRFLNLTASGSCTVDIWVF